MTGAVDHHLLEIALDLSRSMVDRDRLQRLVDALRKAVPCDAAALLRVEADALRPVAVHGLIDDTLGRRFQLRDHPRLAAICASPGPHLFAADSPLPDPFDGLIAAGEPHLTAVHSCLGVPLRVEGELVGVLTADALAPGVFDTIDRGHLEFLGALAAAALRTSLLIESTELRAEYERSLTRQLLDRGRVRDDDMVGASKALDRIRSEVDLVAASDLAVLVTGETGVGKEHVAAAVHRRSARRGGPMVHVNCAALPEALAESELFGHVRGAFTGADRDRPGRFEEADGGTLLLDEIGELSLSLQPKLLRAIQQGEVQRLGCDRTRRFDVRIVAATNRDLVREIDAGRFRSDLYHRLCEFPIVVPPLRDRPEDVPVLAASFVERTAAQLGTGPVRLTRAAHDTLVRHPWPGNVRELQNVLARCVLRATDGCEHNARPAVWVDADLVGAELKVDALAAQWTMSSAATARAPAAAPSSQSLRERVEDFKRAVIREELARHGQNLAAAARALGVQRSNLHTTAKRLGLLGPR